MLAILAVTFPFFALVLCGYLAVRRHMLPQLAIPGLNSFVLYFALPCMLYRFGSTTPLAQLLDGGVFGVYLLCALMMVGIAVAATRAGTDWNNAAFGALVAAFPNTGFMGVPLLLALVGPRSSGPVIVTLVVDLLITTSLCVALSRLGAAGPGVLGSARALAAASPETVGVARTTEAASVSGEAGVAGITGAAGAAGMAALTNTAGMAASLAVASANPAELFERKPGNASLAALRNALAGMLRNPMPWAILLGAVASGAGVVLPPPLMSTIALLADAASPVALFTIGAVLARSQMNAAGPTPAGQFVPLALLKLLLHPLLMLAVGSAAIAAGVPLARPALHVLVLVACLPSASNVAMLSERFGADTGRVARIILVSTVLSFATFSAAVAWLG